MVKRYEELTISDDFMFGKAMGVQGRQELYLKDEPEV